MLELQPQGEHHGARGNLMLSHFTYEKREVQGGDLTSARLVSSSAGT